MHIVWLILKWLLILVLVLLIIGMIYEQYSRYSAKKNSVDNGTYVEVNGQKMHYLKKGEGKVTIVFESGLDFAGHLSWGNVQDEISKFATTISYDRAGILRSQKPTKPRTCDNIAEELHTLVQKVEGNKPFILVVHSLGALIARCYTKKYADTLRGVIFVDASHPEQFDKMPKSIKNKMKIPSNWIISFFSFTGISRFATNKMIDKLYKNSNTISHVKSLVNTYLLKSNKAALEEMKMMEQMSSASKGASFGDTPFTVLTGKQEGKNKDEKLFFELFSKLQEESLNLSTNSKQIFVDSGHYIQLEKPEVVINAIREMIEENKKRLN